MVTLNAGAASTLNNPQALNDLSEVTLSGGGPPAGRPDRKGEWANASFSHGRIEGLDWLDLAPKNSVKHYQSAVRNKARNTMILETRFSELIVTKLIS